MFKKEAKAINTTEKGMKNKDLYDKLLVFRVISFISLVVLLFFEKPIWCTKDYKVNDKIKNFRLIIVFKI